VVSSVFWPNRNAWLAEQTDELRNTSPPRVLITGFGTLIFLVAPNDDDASNAGVESKPSTPVYVPALVRRRRARRCPNPLGNVLELPLGPD